MDMLGSASLVHAGLTDLSGLEGLGDHLSHHHHAAAAAHHHYYAQVWGFILFKKKLAVKNSKVDKNQLIKKLSIIIFYLIPIKDFLDFHIFLIFHIQFVHSFARIKKKWQDVPCN